MSKVEKVISSKNLCLKTNLNSFYENHIKIFGKSQVTAGAATAADVVALLFLVEILKIHYVPAVALASALGGVVNFILNRHWAFRSNTKVSKEALRYFCVSLGSLAWNTGLVWLLTENLVEAYFMSKLIVLGIVGLCWNYPLQRYWVFLRR